MASRNTSSNLPILLIAALSCCVVIAAASGGGYYFYNKNQQAAAAAAAASAASSKKPAAAASGTTGETAPLTSNTTSNGSSGTTTNTPLAPVTTAPLTAQQTLVNTFIPAVNIDNVGDDLLCTYDGSDPSVAKDACGKTSSCVAYSIIAPTASKKGGYCLKGALNNITAGTPTTLYAAPGAVANPDITSWNIMTATDSPGNDIKCLKNGESLAVGQTLCAKDPACNGIVIVSQAAGFSGICEKSSVDPNKTVPNNGVTLYYKSKVTTS